MQVNMVQHVHAVIEAVVARKNIAIMKDDNPRRDYALRGIEYMGDGFEVESALVCVSDDFVTHTFPLMELAQGIEDKTTFILS